MSVREHIGKGFMQLPPRFRRRILHRMGRFAPWESGFDFTPPAPRPGEDIGPPDFVGIGVQKAGTTWWFELMLKHPDISTSTQVHKERHFFDRYATEPFGSRDIDRYCGWFPRQKGSVTGEWTPDYFNYPWAPGLLKAAAPDVRLLLILRDPVERFRSGIAHLKRMGEDASTNAVSDAIQKGFYDRALDQWLETFGPTRLLVLQYERCAVDPATELNSTFQFLDLPKYHPADLEQRLGVCTDHRVGLDPEVQKRLVSIYEADVTALARRVPGLDLSLWPNFSYLADVPVPSDDSNSPVRRV